MLCLHEILARGFFPRELPPTFSTTAFAKYATDGAGRLLSPISGSEPKSAEMCVHNMVRSGGLRRHLGLPNPVHFARLCDFIVQHWTELLKSASRSPVSLTKPMDGDSGRAITGQHDLKVRTIKRLELRASARFILRADVNRFYPSIYTHALPWAIEGKTKVKKAMAARKLNSIWSNELDSHVRNMNDRQTLGLPIGPDTSRLLAEIVLAAVDEELARRIPGLRGICFIDDYEFAVNQRSEADRVASELQSILSQYELALNPTKTCLLELPETSEPLWTSRLRTFVFRYAGVMGQRNDLTAYFDTVFTLTKADPNEGILKYAIARLNSLDVAEDNWPILQTILSQCAMVEPACLPQVCEQILHYKTMGRPVDETLWNDTLNYVVAERLPLGQASEAVWALWLMKQIGLRMSKTVEKATDNCDDSAVALMGLGMASVGLANPTSFTRLHLFAEPSELFGRQWLLSYEGNRLGWLTPPSRVDALGEYAQFDFLRKNGVFFFDIGAPAAAPRRPALDSGSGGGGYPM